MNWVQITKYNPIFRNSMGHYTKDEWTAYSDIGKKYNGKLFTFQDYIITEDAYVYAVKAFMDCEGVSALKVISLENKFDDFDEHYTENMIYVFDSIKNKQTIRAEDIPDVVRLLLRENIWCKLEEKRLAIHVAYDYYMFIGSEKKCDKQIKEIEKRDLFVEPYESPYLDEAE